MMVGPRKVEESDEMVNVQRRVNTSNDNTAKNHRDRHHEGRYAKQIATSTLRVCSRLQQTSRLCEPCCALS
jgi:hypothetical protein